MTEVLKPQPYVGVSGVAHHEQHIHIFEMALAERIQQMGYFVMVGIQSSSKTQVHGLENRRGQMWHPVGDSISDAAANDDSGITKPFVHCYFENDNDLNEGVSNIMRRTRVYNRGIQFNGLNWVTDDYAPFMQTFKNTYPGQEIILQVNGKTLAKHSPKEVTKKLGTMPVEYVLLDPSGGYGIQMDAAKIREYVDEIYQSQIPVGIAVSGGLDSGNIENLLGPLLEEYGDISCDAEGRLRKGPEGKTELDMEAVKNYLMAWKRTVLNSQNKLPV